jgi:hypothetical protein
VGEDVLLGPRVRGVVADHEEVEGRVLGQAAGPLPVVDRHADGPDLPLVAQSREGLEVGLGERRRDADPVELEDVDVLGAERAERRLHPPPDGSREPAEGGTGRDHVALPVAGERLP